MPNERWQADITHWTLAGGAETEILNVLDDHSRFLVASDARVVFKAATTGRQRWTGRRSQESQSAPSAGPSTTNATVAAGG